jgi:hypothetical protein
MLIANIIAFAIIFGATTAPTLAQQSRSKDTIEFNPLAAVRKQHLTRAYLNTQSCLHQLLEAQLYSGERGQQKLLQFASKNCYRVLQQALMALSPEKHTDQEIYAIVLKMAGEELASILARGR